MMVREVKKEKEEMATRRITVDLPKAERVQRLLTEELAKDMPELTKAGSMKTLTERAQFIGEWDDIVADLKNPPVDDGPTVGQPGAGKPGAGKSETGGDAGKVGGGKPKA